MCRHANLKNVAGARFVTAAWTCSSRYSHPLSDSGRLGLVNGDLEAPTPSGRRRLGESSMRIPSVKSSFRQVAYLEDPSVLRR
jgi:hypothetical protein